jgi:aldose 1-epimerase
VNPAPLAPGTPVRLAPLAQGKPAEDPNFICFEPLAAIVNGLNLAHKGLYKDLQSIPPGGIWAESFWIKTSGF